MRDEYARQIIAAGHWINEQGWCPATSGNFSMRLGSQLLGTVSGRHKGRLTPADLLLTDAEGRSLEPDKSPSAEMQLHAQLYRLYPEVGAVLHVHSVSATVLSRLITADYCLLSGYELQKALCGCTDTAQPVVLPIVDNDQDIARLAGVLESPLRSAQCPGYLIRGHGLYTWGGDMAEARRHLEAFEFLFECAILERRLGQCIGGGSNP